MSSIADVIEAKGITEVLHFTTSRSLIGIAATEGIKSRHRLEQDQYLEHIFTPNAAWRKDPAFIDYVNLSISRINHEYFGYSQGWKPAGDVWWCIVALDPAILTHHDVLFSTTNNIYTATQRAEGIAGLEALYSQPIRRFNEPMSASQRARCFAPTEPWHAFALHNVPPSGGAVPRLRAKRVPPSRIRVRRAPRRYRQQRHQAALRNECGHGGASTRTAGHHQAGDVPAPAMTTSTPIHASRGERIRRSALWAAYGDSLGFITEGVGVAGVRRRAGTSRVERPVAWKRRVGGKFGRTVQLPAGCTSDDTQLRLATSRSIRPDGSFDVRTFSKIELPVWLAYALGAGKGSQVAAANLRKRDVSWATNFFDVDRAQYLNGGGNGAAMRIQPHVWSHRDAGQLVTDVVVNAVTTHGHPRGFLGAVFHAHCLALALGAHRAPGPSEWQEMATQLRSVESLIRADSRLNEIWLGQWEAGGERSLARLSDEVVDELEADLRILQAPGPSDPALRYADAAQAVGALTPEQRGSGIKTALLAALAAWLLPDPQAAVEVTSNVHGSDTDTIATMAGAIAGAVADREPDGDILDRAYIAFEADRMAAIGQSAVPATFPYPSLLRWSPPKSASDVVGTTKDGLHIAGLGAAKAVEQNAPDSENGSAEFRWVDLWFGQRMVVKTRVRPAPLKSSMAVSATEQYLRIPVSAEASQAKHQPRLEFGAEQPPATAAEPSGLLSIDELTDRVIASNFDSDVLGKAVLHLSDHAGIEAVVAFGAIIAKARIARRRRDARRS